MKAFPLVLSLCLLPIGALAEEAGDGTEDAVSALRDALEIAAINGDGAAERESATRLMREHDDPPGTAIHARALGLTIGGETDRARGSAPVRHADPEVGLPLCAR